MTKSRHLKAGYFDFWPKLYINFLSPRWKLENYIAKSDIVSRIPKYFYGPPVMLKRQGSTY